MFIMYETETAEALSLTAFAVGTDRLEKRSNT